MRTYEVSLDGVVYTLHPFNLGELEQIGRLQDGRPANEVGFAIFKLALKRASPPIPDPDAVEAEPAEFKAAIRTVMMETGLADPDAKPGEPLPATAAV